MIAEISRKFWKAPSKFYRNFLGNLIDAKFSDKFGTGLLDIFEARIENDIFRYIGLTAYNFNSFSS